MPKRKRNSSAVSARNVIVLAAAAVGLFVGGEAWRLWRSDAGGILLAARFGLGDPARVTRVIGRQIWRGLEAVGVPRDSVRESVIEHGRAAVRWRVGLKPDASLMQANHAITRCLEEQGGEVLSGVESTGRNGEAVVTLLAGLPHRPSHEIVLVRARAPSDPGERAPARVALVLYGLPEDPARAEEILVLPVPFAVAVPPAGKSSAELFRASHARKRELVLHLPLEPINYPQVSPGAGAVLVTMSESKIIGLVRRDLEQAAPVVAVANLMGSLATQDMAAMTAVYRELKRQRLPFLHVAPVPGSVCRTLAGRMGVAYQEPDAVLDLGPLEAKPRALDRRWKALLQQARERGHMVVMVRASAGIIGWLPRATDPRQLGGVDLVPLSALLRRPVEL